MAGATELLGYLGDWTQAQNADSLYNDGLANYAQNVFDGGSYIVDSFRYGTAGSQTVTATAGAQTVTIPGDYWPIVTSPFIPSKQVIIQGPGRKEWRLVNVGEPEQSEPAEERANPMDERKREILI